MNRRTFATQAGTFLAAAGAAPALHAQPTTGKALVCQVDHRCHKHLSWDFTRTDSALTQKEPSFPSGRSRFLSRGVLACGDVPTLLKRDELYVEILGKLVRLNSSAEPSLPRFLLFNLLFLRRD